MENFLKELKDILSLNDCTDVDETIAYFKEFILDAIENGQSEEEALNSLGSPKEVAYSILGDKKVSIEDETFGVINVEAISADIYLDTYDGNKINVECNPSKFEVRNDNDSIYIKEIKDTFLNPKDENIYIHIPENQKFNKVNLISVSGDIHIDGTFFIEDLKIKTVSGDTRIDKFDCINLNTITVSGDTRISDVSINDLYITSVSGDIKGKNIISKNYYVKSVSGDLKFEGIADKLNLNTKSGDIKAYIKGLEEDYHLEYKGMADKKIANKALILNSISGDINYSFEE